MKAEDEGTSYSDISCSRKKPKMSTAQNILLRVSIVMGMVAAVVTVIYFTPMPEQKIMSCDRPCHDLDWPMICRVKLTLEIHQTMNQICQDCIKNSSSCDIQYCAFGDGNSRGILTANRQLPGPPIHVCQNDVLVVDVINRIPGHTLTVHWRGQPNNEAPFMDGASMITQCPINSYTTFQYKFRASSPGTHFYHAHSDTDRSDGLFGALIVRQPDSQEPHRKLYDVDDKDHYILISEWSGDMASDNDGNEADEKPKTLLINGKAPMETSANPAEFEVEQGKRYRFRVAYTGGPVGCPVTLTLDRHLVKVIGMDGNPTNPYEVSSITLSKGERVDFVIKANQPVDSYFLRMTSNCKDNKIDGLALIKYKGLKKSLEKASTVTDKLKEQFLENDVIHSQPVIKSNSLRMLDSSVCNDQLGKICINNVRSLIKLPQVLQEPVDRQIILTFNSTMAHKFRLIENGYTDLRPKLYRINNLTFTYPPSPLLTQPGDVPEHLLCNELNIPEKCANSAGNEEVCECVHIEHIPLGNTAEILLIDQAGDEEEHIFHLHGYQFYVVGATSFDHALTKDEAKALDKSDELVKRNLLNPVLKDTVRVPRFGVVAIRFIANNPGFWLMRDELSNGWTRGLDVVFQVGDVTDMVSSPSNFPTCGDYVGPEFFLL